MAGASFEEVASLVDHLSAGEKIRLVEHIMGTLKDALPDEQPEPLRSLYGLWSDLNVNVSAEDIDEARRKMWKSESNS
jgi:hypothetical protein